MAKVIAGRYRVEHLLGEGAAGSVYLVRDSHGKDRQLALKLLQAPGPRHLELLRHEFTTLKSLHHPNIAGVHDFGFDDGSGLWYYTSEYVEGREITTACTKRAVRHVCSLFTQVLRALQYIHSRGIIHYDIKPGNILVDACGTAKLIDFGLATAKGPITGTMRGTIGYAAPEVVRGEQADGRADLYSLGVTLYEVLTGRHPFQGNSALSVLRRQARSEPARPGKLRRSLAVLDQTVMRMLACEPAGRFPSANEVIRSLSHAVGSTFDEETHETAMAYLLSGKFVGREDEMAYLTGIADSLKAGGAETSIVFITGETGAGKSRLLREAGYRAQLEGINFLHLACSKLQAEPFGPFAEAARALGIAIGRTENGEPDSAIHELAQSLIEFSEKRSAIIALDDLEEGDEDTLGLIEHIARLLWLGRSESRHIRLLFLFACNADAARAKEAAALIEQLVSLDLAERLSLDALSEEAQEHLLASMFGGSEVPEQVVSAVHEAAGGNPFLIEQTVQGLLRSGALFYEGGKWRSSESLVRMRRPVGSQEALKQRIKTLSDDERAAAQILACVGRPAEFELLQEASDLPAGRCAGAVKELCLRRLVTTNDEGCHAFTSGGLGAAVLKGINARRRRSIHRKILSHLEKTGADVIERALHGDKAGLDRQELLPLLREAAGRAEGIAALANAVKLYEAIQRRTEPYGEEWLKALCRLAEIYRQTENVEKTLDYAKNLKHDSLWQYPQLAGEIVSRFVDAHLRAGNADEAERLVTPALKLLSGKKPKGLRAKILSASARIAEFKGEMQEARRLFLRARPLAASERDTEEVNTIDYWLARVDFQCGRYAEAARRARAMLRRKSAAYYRGGLFNLMGVIERTRGKLDKALEYLHLALGEWKQAGNLHAMSLAHENIGSVHFDMDDYERALDAHMPGKRLMQVFGDRVGCGGSLINIGNDHYKSGRVREALASYEKALEIGEETPGSVLTLYALTSCGMAYATFGRTRAALVNLNKALNLTRKAGIEYVEGAILYERARVYTFLCGDLDAAEQDFSRACVLLEKSAAADLADALILSLQISELKGNTDKALQTIVQAEALGLSGSSKKRISLAKTKILLSAGQNSRASKLLVSLEKERLSAQGLIHLAMLKARYEMVSGNATKAVEQSSRALQLARQTGDVRLVFEAALLDAECNIVKRESTLAEKRLAEAEKIANKIADELPEGYTQKHLFSSPFFRRLREIQGRLQRRRSKLSECTVPEKDSLSRRQALKEAGMDERLLMRDGLALLGMVTRLASVEMELQKVLSLALSMVLDITQAERGFIVLVDEDGNLENLVARNILDEEITSEKYQTSRTMVREVMESCKPRLVSDAHLDKLLRSAKSVVDLGLRSILCVPIIHEERTMGVTYLDTTSLAGAFVETDLVLVEEFARRISPIIARAAEQEQFQIKLRSLEEEVRTTYAHTNIIGRSKTMKEMFHILDSVTDTDITVYIYGETGTGKELVAKALHYNSRRKDAPFISINCAALPEPLLESELFGHAKGAFTGADSDESGLIESASGGTLFLDEIGNMPLQMQTKLLRVIEEQQVRRIGSTVARSVNVRFVCASNVPIEDLVEHEDFRADLFYRLNVVRIELPSLQERREDIPLLAGHFAKEFAKELSVPEKPIDPEALAKLCAYNYPGNVRQLNNIIQQAFLISGEHIRVRDMETILRTQKHEPEPQTALERELSIEDYVREFILANQHRYSETELARKLGITRTNLWQKRKKMNIPREK